MAPGTRVVLASPARRLAAAATDVVGLLVLQVILFAMALRDSPAAPEPRGLAWFSLALCWLYPAVSWGVASSSPGKWAWGLAIRRLDGRRMRFRDGLLRVAGYFVACLPAHLGLLPLCWHPRRQGWHDQLAGTVVVDRRSRWQAVEDLPPWPARPKAIGASTSGLWRGFGWVVLGYAGLAVLMTWPVAGHLATRLPGVGPGTDTDHFVWGFWLLDHSLRHGLDPRATDLLFWPQRVSTLNHTMAWLSALASLPLQRAAGLVAAYNLVALGNVVANAAALYLLCLALVKRRGPAFVGGLVFGFSPYFVTRLHDHANLLCAAPLPLVALCGWLTVSRGRARDVVGLAVAVTLAGLADWYYLVFAVVLLVTLWVARNALVEPGPLTWSQQALRLGLTAALSGALLAPLLVPLLEVQQTGRGLSVPDGERDRYRTEPTDYLRPNPYHSARRARLEHTEWITMPGWTILLLAGCGLVRHGRRWRPWLLVALVAGLLSCGPRLGLWGAKAYPRWALLLVGGPPGNGLDPPFGNAHLKQTALDLLAWSPQVLSAVVPVTLPLDWLVDAAPLLTPIKTPGRFGVLVLLVAGPLAAAGLCSGQDWLRRRRGRRAAAWLPGLAGLLVLAEYCSIPIVTHEARPPAFYAHLATSGEPGALVEVPISSDVHVYQLYQTVHRRPISAGHLSRLPSEAFAFADRNSLLHALRTAGLEDPWTPPQGALERGLAELRAVGYAWLILHPDLMRPAALVDSEVLLARLGRRPDPRWRPLLVYRLGGDASPVRGERVAAAARGRAAGSRPGRRVP